MLAAANKPVNMMVSVAEMITYMKLTGTSIAVAP
jgi:hypothetical protein